MVTTCRKRLAKKGPFRSSLLVNPVRDPRQARWKFPPWLKSTTLIDRLLINWASPKMNSYENGLKYISLSGLSQLPRGKTAPTRKLPHHQRNLQGRSYHNRRYSKKELNLYDRKPVRTITIKKIGRCRVHVSALILTSIDTLLFESSYFNYKNIVKKKVQNNYNFCSYFNYNFLTTIL